MVRLAFSSDQVLWWGMIATWARRPSPRVKAPPRGSTMGSQRAMAPADDPASTAPASHAWHRACQAAESFSTDRRCSGEPPER